MKLTTVKTTYRIDLMPSYAYTEHRESTISGLLLYDAIDYLLEFLPQEEVECWGNWFYVPIANYLGWCLPHDPSISFSDYAEELGETSWDKKNDFGYTVKIGDITIVLSQKGDRRNNNSCDDWWEGKIFDKDFNLLKKILSNELSTANGYYGKLPVEVTMLEEILDFVNYLYLE